MRLFGIDPATVGLRRLMAGAFALVGAVTVAVFLACGWMIGHGGWRAGKDADTGAISIAVTEVFLTWSGIALGLLLASFTLIWFALDRILKRRGN